LTQLTGTGVSGGPTGVQLGRIDEIAGFGGALLLEAQTVGPGGVGRELFKLEGNEFSLVSNLTPGQIDSSLDFIGAFDTGDVGGTPIFSSSSTGGGPGNDELEGTNVDDDLSGFGGNDVINGNDGDDILNGNEGDDRLTGGRGVDTLRGGTGNDFYDVSFDQTDIVIENVDEGIDTVRAERPIVLPDNVESLIYEGIRTATRNELNNEMTGNRFFQTFEGLGGDDRIDGGEGEDVLLGGIGDDTLIGGAGDFRDKLVGGNGNDTIEAGGGNDRAFGNSGNDIINGGDGDDVLTGGVGNDQFTGGAGSDRHVAGSGLDVLTDFQSGPAGDVLDLRILGFADLAAVLAITSNNALGAFIQISDGDTISILGVAAGDLNDTNVLV